MLLVITALSLATHLWADSNIEVKENKIVIVPIAPAESPAKNQTNSNLAATVDNIDYIKGARDNSVDMLIAASEKYNAGKMTKDQYVAVALNVSKMASYYKKVKLPLGTSAVSKNKEAASETVASSSSGERVLIGTANNGVDKIYSIRQNSADTKYGYKVVVVPGNPIVSTEYELTIPYTEIKNGQSEVENILNGLPASYKVDKDADKKPIVQTDQSTQGLWRVASTSVAICVHSATSTPQPSGACKIGETAKSSSGAGWANDKIAAEKSCIDKGFEKVKYEAEFKCIPDIYQNAGGM